ncbi:hypothetical protein AU378_18880 [Chryseobacterium kwangjuense]|uniref:Uncharacterized protein n=1 Tax=Chryseobacterium kwangjuense TaxID=267125 RepID=A0A135W6B1_9FLAO|nr:hypothetical protein AU378_18880 [Chryseobacterium kwangjuense]
MFIENNKIKMKIRILYLSHTITALMIFAFRIFYRQTNENVFNNFYKLFNYKIPEIKSAIYFFLIMSLIANGFLNKGKVINQIIILLLLIINCLIIALSIKTW